MISFSDLRARLATEQVVLDKFNAEGTFGISAGDFASKLAPALGVEKEAAALAKAIGEKTEVFRFVPTDDSDFPIALTLGVYATGELSDGATAALYSSDLSRIDATFLKSQIGPGGRSVLKVGSVEVEVDTRCSSQLRNELIACRDDGLVVAPFEMVDGAPELAVTGPYNGEEIPTLRLVPQRDLPPWADEVPQKTVLKVVEVLANSRRYDQPRITVETPEGQRIVGLIATAPIRQALGQPNGSVGESAIGRSFEILAVEDQKRRDGSSVPTDENGKRDQKKIIARDASAPRLNVKL